MGSLDCTHTFWKNCLKAWQGAFGQNPLHQKSLAQTTLSPFVFFFSEEGGSASSFAGSVAPSSVGGEVGPSAWCSSLEAFRLLLVSRENNNSSNDTGDSNHGKRIPKTMERETVNKK
jgi:hypothetical protein